MNIKNSWVLLILILSFPSYAIETSLKKELDNELASLAKEFGIPALALTVITSGKLVYAQGFGFQGKENKLPVTKNTLFRIASISKLFTAQAVMQLAEKNKLNLDDNISKYLPEMMGSKITIRQLLTHSSGLRDQVRPVPHKNRRSTQDYLKLVSTSLTSGGVASEFNYSDTGFNLLGVIVSVVSGMPFEDYIKLNIFTPAKMSHSGYFDGKQGVAADVLPTYKGSIISHNMRRSHDVAFFPSEGLVSSVSDLAKWTTSTLTFQQSILSQCSYKQMYEPLVKTTWGDIYMGLGWQVYRDDGRMVARHPGSIRGYKSLIVTYPEDMNAIILLTNASETPRFEIEKKVTARLRNSGLWQ